MSLPTRPTPPSTALSMALLMNRSMNTADKVQNA